ncbi:MAG: VOC family protein, partial [Chitinophagia bacterium]|nr:VOC family protein [Chitinophagia bacterium]
FKNSKVISTSYYGDGGQVMSTVFELDGSTFYALNGGPHFSFTPAVSFFVSCDNQDEIDYYWDKLVENGAPSRCGWLKDQFGLSWQIVPKILGTLLSSKEPGVSQRVMAAMMPMQKLDIATLEAAAANS